jgi:hypothetical protein
MRALLFAWMKPVCVFEGKRDVILLTRSGKYVSRLIFNFALWDLAMPLLGMSSDRW